jgi:hypothetical protein
MKLSKNKKEKLKKLLIDILHDEELIDFEVEVVGYRDYDITDWVTSLNADDLYKEILKIIED